MDNSNLQIVQRLAELAKNQIEYSPIPKSYKYEHIFLSNVISDSLKQHEREFSEMFKHAVARYKFSLKENKGYGWFHNVENILYVNTYINQLKYIIYGEDYVHEISFKKELGNLAYKDLIEQIDRTVLMTPDELIEYNQRLEKISSEILEEILKEEAEKENKK